MKILITGSTGFIGRHLTEELSTHGHDVVGCDWYATPEALYSPDIEPDYAHDLSQPGVFQAALLSHSPDLVIHLAAQIGRLFGEDDLIRTVRSNAQMTTLIAKACADHRTRLLYASTSEVYGDQGEITCDELEGPFSVPHNIYGLSKRWGEEVCEMYLAEPAKEDPSLRPVHMRFSMPYGPGVPPGRGRAALPNILWQAYNGMEIPIHAGSERAWCWVGDLVRAVRLLAEDQNTHGPYNIGRTDNALPMETLARWACEMVMAPDSLINLIPAPPMQTVVKRLSNARIQEAVGWEPKVELPEGMQTTLDFVKNYGPDANLRTPA